MEFPAVQVSVHLGLVLDLVLPFFSYPFSFSGVSRNQFIECLSVSVLHGVSRSLMSSDNKKAPYIFVKCLIC